MFRRWRLKKIHAKFLESCRNLAEGRAYWDKAGSLRYRLSQLITPIPLLGLLPDGMLLFRALEWLEVHCREQPLCEETIRHYHRLINGDAKGSGEYRKGHSSVVGSSIPRAQPSRIPALMQQLDHKLKQEQVGESTEFKASTLRLAVYVYQRLGLIHPFIDGNGRISRLAMNHILRHHGGPYVIFPPLSEASPLMAAFQDAHAGNLDPLIEFAETCVHPV